jgi:hypothetical protein
LRRETSPCSGANRMPIPTPIPMPNRNPFIVLPQFGQVGWERRIKGSPNGKVVELGTSWRPKGVQHSMIRQHPELRHKRDLLDLKCI